MAQKNAPPTTKLDKKKTIPATKSNQVKNSDKKSDVMDSIQLEKFVQKLAEEISNEVITNTVRNALENTEFTKELLEATIRKAVKTSELQQKFPPLPDTIQKLSEPTTATYIALYNKHRNVLRPKTMGSVKAKIGEYLLNIEEISDRYEAEKKLKADERKARKKLAVKKKKQNEFKIFCNEKCDEMFEKFLEHFTESFKQAKDVPEPLIMGANSIKLFQNIKSQMENLIDPIDDKNDETTKTLTAKKPAIIKKATEIVTTVNVSSQKQTLDAKKTSNSAGADTAVPKAGDTKGANEKGEKPKEKSEDEKLIEKLSYFVMQFVQNSLVEAA